VGTKIAQGLYSLRPPLPPTYVGKVPLLPPIARLSVHVPTGYRAVFLHYTNYVYRPDLHM
jgi:hypothetical protein